MAADGSYYMSVNPNEPRYVGPPSPQMDKAWEDLISRKIICLSRNFAKLIIHIVRYIGLSHSEGMDLADEAFWGRKLNGSYWAA